MGENKNKILRVGFDLDGVILYNPARIVRPLIVFFKKIFLPQEQKIFHLPKSRFQKFIWLLLHKSSFTLSPGYDELIKLIKENRIEAFIVSGRYDSLKGDFNKWLQKIAAKKYFKACYYNTNDEQPHIYKEKMIKKLRLNIFVEDNWDIVDHLTTNHGLRTTNCKIFWIYNIFDRNIKYKYKFPHLKKVIDFIEKYGA